MWSEISIFPILFVHFSTYFFLLKTYPNFGTTIGMLFPINIALCLTKNSDIVYMFRLTNIQAYEVKKIQAFG
jgi:hypothetical protein